jgi:hypothetical protein
MSSARVNFVAAAVLTMATGLFVYTNGALLGPIAHDMLGDGLWAAMIAWLAGAMAPDTRVAVRGAAAYAFCVGIELSQLYHAPTLDAPRVPVTLYSGVGSTHGTLCRTRWALVSPFSSLHDLAHGVRIRIAWMGHDPHAAGPCNRARSPSIAGVAAEPCQGGRVRGCDRHPAKRSAH